MITVSLITDGTFAATSAEINVVGQYFATRYGVAWTGL